MQQAVGSAAGSATRSHEGSHARRATLLVGVDGGGSHCRARATRLDGTPVGEGMAGPANIFSDLAGAVENVLFSVGTALAAGGFGAEALGEAAVGLGLAGANVPAAARAFETLPLPFAAVALEPDSLIACRGAFRDGDGALAIVGTGTAYVARTAGTFTAFGGWGYAVADQGSGAHLGRAGLAAALLAHDRLGPASPLTKELLAAYDDDPAALAGWARGASPADFGRHAPAVMDAADAGDPVARAIVGDAVAAVEVALRRLLALGAPAIVTLGGLAPRYRPYLAADLLDRLTTAEGDALDGALLLARSCVPPC